MKKFLKVLLVLLILFLGVIFFRFLTVSSLQFTPEGTKTDISGIEDAERRFSRSLTYKTISYDDNGEADYEPFIAFREFLRTSFPNIFSTLDFELVNEHSMLLHWKGMDSSLKPVVMMAHHDVVPVEQETINQWSAPPFDGEIVNGELIGRGVVDNKINLMSQFEAVDFLLKQGFTPKRDIYFVSGHDEENGGDQGAHKVAELMHSRGIEAEFVLDEGGFVTNTKVPGVSQPVALIGTSEKGFLTVELTLKMEGGHSSMPEQKNVIQSMSKAVADLSSSPMPFEITPSTREFMQYVAPHSNFINQLALSNVWVFKPMLKKIYSSSGEKNAIVRTTMAPTIIRSGEKSNVVPNIAKATLNWRLLPGTTDEDVINHIKKVTDNLEIEIKVISYQKASEISPADSEAFRLISNAIYLNFEDALAIPFLMIATTDSRHFDVVSPNIYKFSPMIDPVAFHGINEKYELKHYPKAIGFYVELIKSL